MATVTPTDPVSRCRSANARFTSSPFYSGAFLSSIHRIRHRACRLMRPRTCQTTSSKFADGHVIEPSSIATADCGLAAAQSGNRRAVIEALASEELSRNLQRTIAARRARSTAQQTRRKQVALSCANCPQANSQLFHVLACVENAHVRLDAASIAL